MNKVLLMASLILAGVAALNYPVMAQAGEAAATTQQQQKAAQRNLAIVIFH